MRDLLGIYGLNASEVLEGQPGGGKTTTTTTTMTTAMTMTKTEGEPSVAALMSGAQDPAAILQTLIAKKIMERQPSMGSNEEEDGKQVTDTGWTVGVK